MKAARPATKLRSEGLKEVYGEAALEELAPEALEDVAEVLEDVAEVLEDVAEVLEEAEVAEGEPADEDEFEAGRVALPAVLMPLASSYG